MEFDLPIYTAPRSEAAHALKGRFELDPRFVVKPDALALAQARQARTFEAPDVSSARRIRVWWMALGILIVAATFGSMALLMIMGSTSR